MKKGLLIETIRGIILKGLENDDNARYVTYRRIEELSSHVYDETLKGLAELDDVSLEDFTTHYYSQEVSENERFRFVVLPADPSPIMGSRGITYVKSEGSYDTYPRMSNIGTGIFDSLLEGKVRGPTYRLGDMPGEDNKCIIFSYIGSPWGVNTETVDCGLILPFSAYGEDDNIPMVDYNAFMATVLELYGQRMPDDKTNNGE